MKKCRRKVLSTLPADNEHPNKTSEERLFPVYPAYETLAMPNLRINNAEPTLRKNTE